MQSAPIITYRNMDPSPALEEHIQRRIAELEREHPRLIGCEVVIHAPHKKKVNARDFEVRLTLRVPGPDIHAARHVGRSGAAEDVNLAVHEVFDAARRSLKEQKRKMGIQETKHHPPLLHGRIDRLFEGEGYGFIAADDGKELYFQRDSLVAGNWDDLKVDQRLKFREMAGDKGVFAVSVAPADD